MPNKIFILLVFNTLIVFQFINAQSKIFLNPGFFYNGTGFSDDVNGIGLIAGLEYMPSKYHLFSIELRTKYGYYAFDDGTKWKTDKDGNPLPPKNRGEDRLKYNLFNPQVGVIPKLHLYFDEDFSLFLENEIAIGLMAGEFRYKGFDKKKKFTDLTFCYNIGLGIEYQLKKCILVGSAAYSTLNFRSKIIKYQPTGYEEWIPNQNALFLISILFKIPIYNPK